MQNKNTTYMLIAVVFLTVLAAFGYKSTTFNLGLDVRGGARFTYELELDKLTPEQRAGLELIKSNTRKVMEQRVSQGLGVVDGTVQLKGSNQVIVELPGKTDLAEAEKLLGTSASIKLYHAKTVKTELATYRKYQALNDKNDTNPVVSFMTNSGKDIKPGTPEYKEIIDGWDLILSGDDLANARGIPYGNGWQPDMSFSTKGAAKLEAFSKKVLNKKENIAFVLDGVVISIAPIQDGAILSDQAVIQGSFTQQYVNSFVNLLNSGALPVDLKKVSQETVDPTIGGEALNKMVTAGAIAFGVIAAFMLLYYGWPGFIAIIALILYCLFTITVMKLINATFSLAAIAGLILSVGMAVDANILVFERFKEEAASGKSLLTSMELGFKRALPAIFDSNACTALTSFVLGFLGTGPVRGFATSLIIGVAISLFTAVTVTRTLLLAFGGRGATNEKLYAVHRQWFRRVDKEGFEPLQVVNQWKRYFLISTISILPGLIFVFTGGFKPNVEFRGGYEAQYKVDSNATSQSLQFSLDNANLRGGNVKISTIGTERIAIISLPPLEELKGDRATVVNKIAGVIGVSPDTNKGFTEIGPAIQKETLQNAITGVLISSFLIAVFLAFRFGFSLGGVVPGMRFGLSAIGALIHDVLFVLAVAGAAGHFLNWEISALFITSMLTIIGFSVHDTIVVFDRIRENLRRSPDKDPLEHLMNKSITQTFARSINTSMTVIVTLAILAVIGTPTVDLKFFVVAMLFGIVSGTYSSIFNAAPILYLWDRAVIKKKGEEAGLVGIARAEKARNKASVTVAPAAVKPTTIKPTVQTAKPIEVDEPKPEAKPEAKPAEGNKPQGPQRTYGQVKRRANQPKPEFNDLED